MIEFGQSTGSGSADLSGNTLYALGVNNNMIPGLNAPPNAQTAGNVFNLWGNIPLTGLQIGWAEGTNLTGAIVHGDASTGYHSVPITVKHGRASNVNQSTAGANVSVPYPTISDVTYQDCTGS